MESQKEVYAAEAASYGSVRAFATDEPSKGDGARHHYRVTNQPQPGAPEIDLGVVKFQDGLPGDVGYNGVTDESLLAVLIDHVQGFQHGPCNSEANRNAAWNLQEAMRWLKHRQATERGAIKQ